MLMATEVKAVEINFSLGNKKKRGQLRDQKCMTENYIGKNKSIKLYNWRKKKGE